MVGSEPFIRNECDPTNTDLPSYHATRPIPTSPPPYHATRPISTSPPPFHPTISLCPAYSTSSGRPTWIRQQDSLPSKALGHVYRPLLASDF
nr:hypothetical protein Itr_chr04CG10930 [Ipomoea trifida]